MRAVMICAAVWLLCAMSRLASADGLIVIEHAPPRLDHFPFAPLEVTFHHVDVDIKDNVATTRVDQEFYNPNPQPAEGTYLFPLPEGATIDKFAMDIDGKPVDAELLDATRAKQTYEEIVRKYRDPALLEYVGRGAMKVRIFPIEPNGKKHIALRYTQVLKPNAGLTEYTYQLNTEKFSAKPIRDVSIRVKVSDKSALKSVYSPSHTIDVHRDGSSSATVGFEARDARPDTDFKLIYSTDPDAVGINLLTFNDGKSDGYFMLLASPGSEPTAAIEPRDIVFVLDTSGSMAGEKLEQAKKALTFCLANLNETDRFEIVRFSTEAESLFHELRDANKSNIATAQQFVDSFKPMGGTALDDALAKATAVRPHDSKRPFSVIFLTDGQPTIGETNEDKIVARVAPERDGRGVHIFSFGVGTDVNTNLLDRIASSTQSFSQYVMPKEDIEVKVSNFFRQIQAPVMSDVRITCDDPEFRLKLMYPGTLPDLYQGQTLLAFGRYTLPIDRANTREGLHTKLTLSGSTGGSVRSYSTDALFETRATDRTFIPRMWATRRVGWLLDEIRLHGESKELVDEITQLSRENGIVTPYTAYLIMQDERTRNVLPERRVMRELGDDAITVSAAGGAYQAANGSSPQQQKAGPLATENALALNSLKGGDNLSLTQQRMGLDKASSTTQPAGYRVNTNYAQQVRVVNGQSFYQNANTWTDPRAQALDPSKKVEIEFGTDAYFALLTDHPEISQTLALGSEIDVVIDGTLYVIR